ncbi:ccaat-binding transcription factor subunit hapb [Grosmannia clavigera kw1407]|uniref:Transcriptional activator HAP2 n=1 Tax=Grosmannia clavigera (strain kw1407 / UAMH 11150) TaxID=655863 RepID=F0XDQ6_GROCL|nr:ccaat-binding transcription factor subunit hapb [Grosmannia clavigera kw1407]EFX04486.1 ccaat-binding transcription factor subunit hapb [Grosmannia clavigera kw1407]
MMEYAQYQPQPQNGHVQNIQAAYPNAAAANGISPPQHQSSTARSQDPNIRVWCGAYPYGMSADPAMQQNSPRLGSKKEQRNPRSPPLNNINAQGRRLSQVTSPGLPNAQAILNHNASRAAGVPSTLPPQQQIHAPQSPELAAAPAEESPLYVNAKQFHRILKRRVARQRLEEALRLTSKGRKPYLHESRHNHAMRRPRGPGGRFLTADEVAAMERKDGQLEGDIKEGSDAGTSEPPAEVATPSSGKKRKTESGTVQLAKKAKAEQPIAEEDEEDGEDDG